MRLSTIARESIQPSGAARWRRVGRYPTAVVAALLLVVGTAACTSPGETDSGSSASALTIANDTAPPSLNPALAGTGHAAMYIALAYDPLIYKTGDGELVPDLATSWEFVNDDFTKFQLTIRSGVTFTDGSPLTAEAVVASMQYFLSAGGPLLPLAGPIDSVSAVGDDKVLVTYKSPYSLAADTFSIGIGQIIGPDGLADPESLGNSTDGTGSYIYDGDSSVANSSYVYTKNPDYFNPDAQKFEDVTVNIITDASARLSAIQTGQAQFAAGSISTVSGAEQAGLDILSPPYYNWSLLLHDAAGTVNKPLGDARVRQAIAYAFDRDSLATALGGEYASASTQVLLSGADGYVPDFGYDYDVKKAKSLLAEAGYPDGFSMTMVDLTEMDQNSNYAQAVVGALEDIGITVTLRAVGAKEFFGDVMSKQYEAALFPTTATSTAYLYSLLTPGGLWNPFGSTDPELDSLMAEAFSASDETARTAIYQDASRRYNELAWAVPLFGPANLWYVSPELTNVTASVLNPNPNPAAPTADLAWQLE